MRHKPSGAKTSGHVPVSIIPVSSSIFYLTPRRQSVGSRCPAEIRLFRFLWRQLLLPSRRRADMVFVEPERVTVVELKKTALRVTDAAHGEDVVDQVVAYL